MAIVQKLRKLRKMSFREVFLRVNERWQTRRDRSRDVSWSGAASGGARLVDRAQRIVPGGRANDFRWLRTDAPRAFDEMASRAVAAGEAVLGGQTELLGSVADLGQPFDWHRDPLSGYARPRDFYADLNFCHLPNGVDVKHIWERGRMQYLATLARAWRFSGRGEFAEHGRTLLLDWIENNPPFIGVHWTSALELSMRAISWAWMLATLDDWDGWSKDDLGKVAESLAAHGHYLECHFSHFSSPYNHLMGEAAGLLLVADCLPDHPRSKRWRSKALDVLATRSEEQLHADGYTVEQASGYHFYTTGFLSLAHLLLERSEQHDATSKSVLAKLERLLGIAFPAGLVLKQSNGRWPCVGDLDSARTFPTDLLDYWNFESLANLGAVILRRPTLKQLVDSAGDEVYWLMGQQGWTTWQDLDEPSQATEHDALADAGYLSHRSDGDWVILEAGPVAAGVHTDATPSVAHGHDDSLQVLIGLANEPVTRDAGIPYYSKDLTWVEYFRDAQAHNVPRFVDDPLVQHAGRLAWSHSNGATRLRQGVLGEYWCGIASVETDRSFIQRAVLFGDDAVWVADIYNAKSGDSVRTARWNWQLDESFESVTQSDGVFVCSGQNGTLTTWSSEDAEMELACGVDGSPVGWHAPLYGTLVRAARLQGTVKTEGTACVLTRFARNGKQPPSVQFHTNQKVVGPKGDGSELPQLDFGWRIVRDGDEQFVDLNQTLDDVASSGAR